MSEDKLILIVDDDADVRDYLTGFLEAQGYRVKCAENGQQAIRFLSRSKERPALILLDLMMPLMDGKTFLTMLQDYRKDIRDIPIVVTTALGSGEQVEISPLIRKSMSKPLNLTDLKHVVERYVA